MMGHGTFHLVKLMGSLICFYFKQKHTFQNIIVITYENRKEKDPNHPTTYHKHDFTCILWFIILSCEIIWSLLINYAQYLILPIEVAVFVAK